MRLVFVGLAILVMLVVGVRTLYFALASDETKIRWLVEQMEEGYDEGDVSDCVGPLAKDWRHEGQSELDRDLLKGGLLREFLQEGRDSETKERTRKVDVVDDSLSIAVTDETATLSVRVAFSRKRASGWEETWRAEIEADLRDGDDGWKIVKTRHADLDGSSRTR